MTTRDGIIWTTPSCVLYFALLQYFKYIFRVLCCELQRVALDLQYPFACAKHIVNRSVYHVVKETAFAQVLPTTPSRHAHVLSSVSEIFLTDTIRTEPYIFTKLPLFFAPLSNFFFHAFSRSLWPCIVCAWIFGLVRNKQVSLVLRVSPERTYKR